MMRIALLSVVFLAALVAGGCARSQFDTDTPSNFVQADGLKVEMQLPGRYFKTGDDLRVAVTATNMTGKPISIHSPTGAPVVVRVFRHTMLTREQVRVYPASATSNILSWALPAKQSRTFGLIVPIEPDWPIGEVLHVSAELNGYGKLAPAVAVVISEPKKK
jgi:hypothetical protein